MSGKTISLFLLLVSMGSWAQTDSLPNRLSLNLNHMTHGEVRGGGLPDMSDEGNMESNANFLLGRTRLNVNFQRPGLEVQAVLQNTAIWGMKGNQNLELYEAWVKMRTDYGLFAQVGRVALAYDDERIIGPNDFATASKAHDLLRLGYEGYGHQFHAILSYNQNASNIFGGSYYKDGAQYYKTMHTFWYHYDVPHFPLGASLLFMNIGEQAGVPESDKDYATNPERTVFQQIYGGYVNFHPKYLTLEGSYYRQTGTNADEKMNASPIDAWMAGVKATIKPSDRYGFVLGYDYLSGDEYMVVRQPGTLGSILKVQSKGFTPVYGSRTKFYGILDYFYRSAYLDGSTPGLQNTFVGGYYKPTSRIDCGLTYHYLGTATKLSGLEMTLGHAVEFEASYRFSDDISLKACYTQMHGTNTMDRLKQNKGDKNARWGWFSLVVSPKILTTKW